MLLLSAWRRGCLVQEALGEGGAASACAGEWRGLLCAQHAPEAAHTPGTRGCGQGGRLAGRRERCRAAGSEPGSAGAGEPVLAAGPTRNFSAGIGDGIACGAILCVRLELAGTVGREAHGREHRAGLAASAADAWRTSGTTALPDAITHACAACRGVARHGCRGGGACAGLTRDDESGFRAHPRLTGYGDGSGRLGARLACDGDGCGGARAGVPRLAAHGAAFPRRGGEYAARRGERGSGAH